MPTASFEATYFIIENDYMTSYLLQLIGDMKDVLTRLDSDLLIYIGILECVCVFLYLYIFLIGDLFVFQIGSHDYVSTLCALYVTDRGYFQNLILSLCQALLIRRCRM